ncbi:hypothetical protein X726_10535 [Mesorhizobium sp. L103C105A0]|nr:hypothetical protein X726_10535 [Mesorhizobium sp. L103C105A0]
MRLIQSGTLGKVTLAFLAAIPAPRTKQQSHAFRSELVQLVDRAQHRQPTPCILIAAKADRFQHAIEHLAIVDADDVVAALDAERFHHVGHHHRHFSISRDARCADGVSVELHELAEAAGAGLFVAEHPAGAVAAIGLRQSLKILGDITRRRRGQVVAQRQPLLVIVLERKYALIRPVLVGQEFAQRIGVFDQRLVGRLETIELIDRADRRHHLLDGADVFRTAVGKAARQPRFRLFRFVGHGMGLFA